VRAHAPRFRGGGPMRLAPTLAKFGLFAVISLFCGVVVVNTINRPENGDTHTYHAVFTDASGVLTGSEVRIAGVRVGKVTDVVLHDGRDRKSTRLNSSHVKISYAVFCL